MIIELLIIANEVLNGHTQDTNSHWMAKKIIENGHILSRITTVGDDLIEISNAIKEIINRKPNIVITSGGLI
ncbi:MAG: hypothetical protein JXA99_08590 [Candidatus Lokiarchaeota archaeon]|nr:hypothetical protein [Candidatus Lokiarchaeota archaeon]